ncbi:MAG: hypothetical protein AB1813_23765 [Verrucomicrobiota bacterium]
MKARCTFCVLMAFVSFLPNPLDIECDAAELRGARLFKSGPIQISADGQWVWWVNPDNDSVSRLHTSSEVVDEFPLPDPGLKDAPKGLSLKEDGSEVWVACHDSDKIYVLNGADGTVLAEIDLPWGSGAYSIALSPDQKKALVTLHRAEAVAALDVPGRKRTHILRPVFWGPMGVAWTEQGQAAWINHLFAPGEHPLQTRVDFSSSQPHVTTAIRITPADPRQSSRLTAPFNVAEGGYLNVRGHGAQIPIATGRNELWLPTQYHNFTEDNYSTDSTMQSAVRHINLGTRQLLEENTDKVILTARYVHKPSSNGAYEGPGWNAGVAGPVDLAFSVDGSMVYVLHELSAYLVVMRSDTAAVKPAGAAPLPEIRVGDRPIGLAVSPNAPVAYVLNQLSRDISVVDLAGLKEIKRLPATPQSGEPFPIGILRGAKIFHSSDDTRISRNAKVSCASCHINGEHDGRTWNFQNLPGNHGPRSVPSLLGLNLTFGPRDPLRGWGQLHRSGDRDEIQDFEHTFRGVQMGGTGFLGSNIQPELGPPNAGRSEDLDALAAYLLSLDPIQRSPHRTDKGELSEAAVRGATFFLGANRAQKRGDASCAVCHVPETGFVDFKFHDVGQRRDDAQEEELNSRTPAWHVNTLTLVGVWTTPPYAGVSNFPESHSAEGNMIELLLDAARRSTTPTPHGKPNGLTGRQLADLAEFVLSIDGRMTSAEVRNARDAVPPRIERVEPTSLTRLEVWFNETVKESTVENPQHWRLTEHSGAIVPVTLAVWDPQNGDRVTLHAALKPHTAYALQPAGPILDDADAASGGVANPIDVEAAHNRHEFTITDRLTITLGASGYENLTIPVHDAAMVGPGLSTWNHDSIWLFQTGSTPRVNTGFVRFGWQTLFKQVSGVTNAAQILEAVFELHPELGDAQAIEIRRVLKRWSDAATGADFNQNATGAPTWRDASHPNTRWNQAGAGRLGSNGTNVSDYNGVNDLAVRVDAIAEMKSIIEPAVFRGALVTDAFRFWFDNPSVDYGYALRLGLNSTAGAKFERWESGLKQHGPVLQITYLLPGARPKLVARSTANGVEIRWPSEPDNFVLQSAPDIAGPWSDVTQSPIIVGPNKTLVFPATTEKQFFRLLMP